MSDELLGSAWSARAMTVDEFYRLVRHTHQHDKFDKVFEGVKQVIEGKGLTPAQYLIHDPLVSADIVYRLLDEIREQRGKLARLDWAEYQSRLMEVAEKVPELGWACADMAGRVYARFMERARTGDRYLDASVEYCELCGAYE